MAQKEVTNLVPVNTVASAVKVEESTLTNAEAIARAEKLNAIAAQRIKGFQTHQSTGGIGGSSAAVLKMLREKGTTLLGMSAGQVREQFKIRDDKETRKRIRIACDSAVANGDLVFTPRHGRNAVVYVVVPAETAKLLSDEVLKGFVETSKDYRYDSGPFARTGRFVEMAPIE